MAGIVIVLILIADQVLKIWVKTHFYLGESVEIFPFFELKFIENNGMAFGIELWSKLLLTLLRIAAVVLLILGIRKLLTAAKDKVRTGFIICIALITAGAAGNIFDCVFYGEIFNDPIPPEIATLFPRGGGYASWFEGRVVDMLYFPFFTIRFPDWMPLIGGKEWEFFQYIFNIADAAICVGVLTLIFFFSNDFYAALSHIRGEKATGDKKTTEVK